MIENHKGNVFFWKVDLLNINFKYFTMKKTKQIQFVAISPEESNQPIFDYLDKKFKEIKKSYLESYQEIRESYQPKEPTKYLTKQEVSKLLCINLASVNNWTKKKILQSYRIGGRVLYKLSEIEESIVKLQK